MRQSSCAREVEVAMAVRTGKWEGDLSAHAAGCAECKEIVQTSKWMQGLAQSPQTSRALPDASLAWRRAQFSESQANVERARELLDWVEIISATVISAGLAGWIGWNWYAIQSKFISPFTDPWPQLWIDAAFKVSATPILFSLGAVILSLVVFAVGYPLLIRE